MGHVACRGYHDPVSATMTMPMSSSGAAAEVEGEAAEVEGETEEVEGEAAEGVEGVLKPADEVNGVEGDGKLGKRRQL